MCDSVLASSAVLQASEWLAVTQVASCGELQLNLGATQPPSSLMPASIAALSSGKSGRCSKCRCCLMSQRQSEQRQSMEACTSSSEHRVTGDGIHLHLVTIILIFRQSLFLPILVVGVQWI